MSPDQPTAQLTPLQNAVYLLKQAQAKLAAYERAESEPLAVIGMSCRFPGGATHPQAFWKLLSEGVNAVGEVPKDRWDIDEYYDPDPSVPGKMNTRWGGFLAGIDEFDAEFFGISPREAVRVDPQHRLLLEVAWEALEDAGLPAGEVSQTKAGVYVGAIGSDYALLQSREPANMDVFSGTGISHAILANRLSYVLNLTGPSVALDTACSSSLVTVHLACQSLRRRESDLALAGGVNLILSPEMTLGLTKAHMMAPDGRCKTFDAAADGYVRGEGCGLVVLKRLSDALAAGDRVLAVIRGSAVNHDGRSNGLSAPNGPAQEAVLRTALADARLAARDIDYIEAHGTGTRLGDPIEIEALRSVLCAGRAAEKPLVVASLKTNIGHLESAAGVAGLIKVILMLRHGQIPAHLHMQKVNPLLRLEDGLIEIPTSARAWPAGDKPRRAGVSSFGFGGTNAHVILEEAPRSTPVENVVERPRHIVTLSARSPQALAELATRYADFAETCPAVAPAELGYTSNTGRVHFDRRAAVVGASAAELRDKLRAFVADPSGSGIACGQIRQERPPRIAFLFTGQGAQYPGMGRTLYETQPTFRRELDRCAEILRPHLDRPLLSLLSPDVGPLLDQTGYTQPVMFAIEYALAAMWRSWGVEPAAVMGHSVGEFAAACVAGVYSLEDGLRLIAERARLMQSLPAGGLMAAVLAPESRVAEALASYAGQVAIAAINGPESIVVSGDEPAVREVLARIAEQGIQTKVLATSHAFHSQRMDPILEQLGRAAAAAKCAAPNLSVVANLTGQLATRETYADPAYWTRHARLPVRFADGMRTLGESGCEVFLEIGPSPTLVGMGRRCLTDAALGWLPSLRPGHDEWSSLLDTLAQLYVRGAKIDWAGFDGDYHRQRIALPSYPFQKKRFWSGAAPGQGLSSPQRAGKILHPLLGSRLVAAVTEQVFEAQIAANRPATLGDHLIQGVVVMPGAAYLEMALAASAAVHGAPWQVCGTALVEPLLLDKTPKTVQTILTPDGVAAATFRIVSVSQPTPEADPVFTTHAMGRLEKPAAAVDLPLDIELQRARFDGPVRDDKWQAAALRKSGITPGPTFSWSPAHWVNAGESLAELRPAREADHAELYQIHPGLLDTALQALGAALPDAGKGIDAYVPMSFDRLTLYERPAQARWCLTTLTSLDGKLAVGDAQMLDAGGRVLLKLEGVRLRRVPRDWLTRLVAGPLPDWCYELAWEPQALDPATKLATPDQWLIFAACGTIAATLATRLEALGHACTIVPAGGNSQSRRAAVTEFLASGPSPSRGVVYLSGLDVDGAADAPDFAAARELGWGGALDVMHALTEAHAAKPPRLWLVTAGAQAVGDRPLPLALAQSPLWGFARVIAAEHPDLACTRIDLDPQATGDQADQLVEELLHGGAEDQVAYRGQDRRIARLRRLHRNSASALQLPKEQPYRLEITSRGQLDDVALRAMTRPQPGPGQVEIRVGATGLNFRDVLNVLDLYPGDPGPLGGECAGEVAAIGPGVEHVKPGDRVVALAPASFASYALTLAPFCAPIPDGMSDEQAATIPICFLTAHHALCRLGQMRPGERVLIHAASGGVGLAAIQIAKQVGAEIFATAGSPRKREYLRSLDIEHIMDSRTLDFANQVLETTGGEGVDLVLNSLTGETIGASLSVLRAGGRFLELGKTDLWDQRRVDEFRPGVTFYPIALDQMMADDPADVGQLIGVVMPQFASGQLQPLPLRAFGIAQVVDALRHMARAEHIGKVIIQAAPQNDASERPFTAREDGTYLLTGGLGGLGLKLARWLADRGARNIVLLGRSAPSDEARRQIAALEEGGVRVETRSCDVGAREQIAALLERLRADMPPLVGIFHLAGVLDDGVIREQDRVRFDRVLGAKALGAWYLHELTRDLPVELFVLFSSAAALLGSPGQGNYAAANAFLDALAHHRRAQKLPALSVNWGSWSEVGMAAKLKETEGRRWAASGLGWIEPARGIETLERLLVEDRIQAGVLPVDWPKFFARIPSGSEPAWLSTIAREERSAAAPVDTGPPVLLDKLTAVTPAERLELAVTYLRQQAGRVLAMDDANLPDPRRTLNEVGFDSLTAVEFCTRISRAIGQHLNPALLFDYPTLERLASYVVCDVLHLETTGEATPNAAAQEAEAEAVRQQAVDDVEGMSEADMDALVTQQLERLQK